MSKLILIISLTILALISNAKLTAIPIETISKGDDDLEPRSPLKVKPMEYKPHTIPGAIRSEAKLQYITQPIPEIPRNEPKIDTPINEKPRHIPGAVDPKLKSRTFNIEMFETPEIPSDDTSRSESSDEQPKTPPQRVFAPVKDDDSHYVPGAVKPEQKLKRFTSPIKPMPQKPSKEEIMEDDISEISDLTQDTPELTPGNYEDEFCKSARIWRRYKIDEDSLDFIDNMSSETLCNQMLEQLKAKRPNQCKVKVSQGIKKVLAPKMSVTKYGAVCTAMQVHYENLSTCVNNPVTMKLCREVYFDTIDEKDYSGNCCPKDEEIDVAIRAAREDRRYHDKDRWNRT